MDPKRIANVTEEPPARPASSAAYPFTTRKQIGVRLESDPAFMMECAAVLQARTEQRAAGSAPAGKPYGWMSSERVVAGRLVAKSTIGMLSEEEELKLGALVSRYSRQLADHFRGLALAENPGLSEAAAKFGVGPTASDPSDIVQGPRDPQERAERCHPSGEEHGHGALWVVRGRRRQDARGRRGRTGDGEAAPHPPRAGVALPANTRRGGASRVAEQGGKGVHFAGRVRNDERRARDDCPSRPGLASSTLNDNHLGIDVAEVPSGIACPTLRTLLVAQAQRQGRLS